MLEATPPPVVPYTPEIVAQRLYHAGTTLLALQVHGLRPAQWRSTMPVPMGTVADDNRAAVPSARHISDMDQALSWVQLIPEERMILRHLVNARCLCNPRSGKPLYSWRVLGARLGCSHIAARTWWHDALGIITTALNRPLFCHQPAFVGTKVRVPRFRPALARASRRERADEFDLVG